MVEDKVKQHFLCNFGIRIENKDRSISLPLCSKCCIKITWIQNYLSLCRLLYKEMTVWHLFLHFALYEPIFFHLPHPFQTTSTFSEIIVGRYLWIFYLISNSGIATLTPWDFFAPPYQWQFHVFLPSQTLLGFPFMNTAFSLLSFRLCSRACFIHVPNTVIPVWVITSVTWLQPCPSTPLQVQQVTNYPCLKAGMIPASHEMYYLWLNQKETVRTMQLSFSECAGTGHAMENKKPGRWSELGKDMMHSLKKKIIMQA